MRPAEAGPESGPPGEGSISPAIERTPLLPHLPQRSEDEFVMFSQFWQ
jgi:hypothetical protein